MPSVPSLINSFGRPIALAQRLGDPGGEGTVYSLAGDSELAAKVYHSPQPQVQLDKLSAMVAIANPRLT